MKKRWVLTAIAVIAPVVAGYILGRSRAPLGQQPLVSLTAAISELQAAFNDAADRPRLLLLLSPT